MNPTLPDHAHARTERAGRARGLLSGLALVLLTAPYWALLGAPVMGGDSAGWVEIGRLTSFSDLRKIFGQGHFVGYRPITALSFAIGSSPEQQWLVHALNLVILLLCLATLHRALRAAGLTPRLSLLAVAAVALHPVIEEVVVFSDRRADLLLSWFSMAYLCAVLQGRGIAPRLAWLLLALGSKEPAVVLPLAVFAARLLNLWRDGAAVDRRPLLSALRATAPDLFVLFLFLSLRHLIIGRVGGYVESGLRHLVPLDYFTGVFTPQIVALWSVSRWLGVALVGIVSALFIASTPGRGFARDLFLCALILDFLLYVAVGRVWSRALLAATLYLVAQSSIAAARNRRTAFALLLVIAIPWSVLHLLTHPSRRIELLGRQVRQYTERLETMISELPSGQVQVVLCDSPEGWQRSLLQERVERSTAHLLGTSRDVLMTHLHLARMINAGNSERTVHFLVFGHLVLDRPDAQWTTKIALVEQDSAKPFPSRVRVDLELSGARAFVFPSYMHLSPDLIESEGSLHRIRLSTLRPRSGSSWLCVPTDVGRKPLPLPDVLELCIEEGISNPSGAD